MKKYNAFSIIAVCISFFVFISMFFSGCGLTTIIEHQRAKKITSANSVSSIVQPVDKNRPISSSELELLDGIARVLYYVEFNSVDSLNDNLVLEYISAILHDQDSTQKDYLVTPESTNEEYKLEASVCKEISMALFGYELGDEKIVGGKYIFPYAGGIIPKISERDIFHLEDGSYRLVYTVKVEGPDGEYIINNKVTLNVVRQNNKHSAFRIISIISADG